MEKKRKTLLLNCLLFVVLVSSLLVLASCDQPGSVVDSSSQDKTTPEENSGTPVTIYFDGIVASETDSDDSVETSGQEDDGNIESAEVIEDEKPNIIRVELVKDESDKIIDASLASISEIKLSPQSYSVGYDGEINITAQISPAGANLKDLKWSLKYADGNEVGENDGVSLIDNGDGTCTLVHKKVSYGFDVVVTAYTDEVSDSCTIKCRKGGHGVLDYATDGFVKEEDYDTHPE